MIVQAVNADGSAAILEIQAKRTLTFTTSDAEFTDVVAQMWEAAQKPEFETSRYELAVAIARTTTRVEFACQEVLHWARQLPDGATFAAHINREKFSSKACATSSMFSAPISRWRVRRPTMKPFGGCCAASKSWSSILNRPVLIMSTERVSGRAWRSATDQADRAADLWPVLIDQAGAFARAGGASATVPR